MSDKTAPPLVFDRSLIAQRFIRNAASTPDFITEMALADLTDRLSVISRAFARALIMGPVADWLPQTGQSALATFEFARMSTLTGTDCIDPESLHLPRKDYDLIVSVLDLQMINDVPGFLTRLRQHLAPDGLALVATVGGGSLEELALAWLSADDEIVQGVTPRVAPFIDVRSAGALLQRAGFALPVTDVEHHIVRYADPFALMRELKHLGASNPLANRSRKPVSRTHLALAAAKYAEAATDDDGRVRASLEIIWMSGWNPHESQQRPLKPGSATTSMADALKGKSGDDKPDL